jgi:hypothetical protein
MAAASDAQILHTGRVDRRVDTGDKYLTHGTRLRLIAGLRLRMVDSVAALRPTAVRHQSAVAGPQAASVVEGV